MDLQTDQTLNEILRRLKTEFNPLKVILYGSRARGSNTSESDYDLLVIVKNSNQSWLERCQRANRLLRGTGAAIDILVVTEEEFDSRAKDEGSIYQIASSEGEVLQFG